MNIFVILFVIFFENLVSLGRRPPSVNLDAIPREITVKAGKKVALEIPYTGLKNLSIESRTV